MILNASLTFLLFALADGKKFDTDCDGDEVYDVSLLDSRDSYVFTSHKKFGSKNYGKREQCLVQFKVSTTYRF